MKAPLPANEDQRLQALQSYTVLDTPDELLLGAIQSDVAS